MNAILRYLWFMLVARPLVLLGLGVNVRNRERLGASTPAIIVANHNSHLDTIVLLSLLPLRLLNKARPVAAMDYFLKNKLLAWFALKIMGIIPIDRRATMGGGDPLAGCSQALERGDILILFPEGTRGQPEQIASFKTGVAHLAKRFPSVPVIPIFMHGLGKALPRGEWVLVPFFCDVVVGEEMFRDGSREDFMDRLENTLKQMAAQVSNPAWE